MVAHTRRAGHLDPLDQPGKLASECVLVVAADYDLDAAVGRGISHLEPSAERHPEQAYLVGRAHRPGLDGCSLAFDLVRDRVPALSKVEVFGPVHGIASRLDGRHAVDPEGPPTGLGAGDEVPPRAGFDYDAQRVDGLLGFGAFAVDIAEPDLDAADHRVLELVEEVRRSGLDPDRPPSLRVYDERRSRRLGLYPERLRQGMDELAQRRFHGWRDRRGRAGGQEQGADLTRGQPGQVGAGAAHEAPAAAPALHGVHRHAGHAQGVEVAAGGALGDLQLPGDLRCGHLLAALQQHEDGHQPVSSHTGNTPT